MRISALILAVFILSGCFECQPVPCKEQKCDFPKLPTYKVPASRKLTVKPVDAKHSIILNDDLIELVRNNTKLRRVCSNYAAIAIKVNGIYEN